MMNTWYGYPEIPVGRVRDGVVLKRDDYARAVCESGLFPRSRRDRDYGDPVTLYRRLLAESPDSSVVVVSVRVSRPISAACWRAGAIGIRRWTASNW